MALSKGRKIFERFFKLCVTVVSCETATPADNQTREANGKISGYHEGDRSEYLGRFLLSALGHTVMVERPSDYFGVDLYLKLFTVKSKNASLKLSGYECAFQLKSKSRRAEVRADDDESRLALYDLRQPIFICLVDRTSSTLEIYHTLGRFFAYWTNPASNVGFAFKEHRTKMPYVAVRPRRATKAAQTSAAQTQITRPALDAIIYCGEPIIRASHADFEDPSTSAANIALYRQILEEWIDLDNQAIAWKISRLPVAPHMNDYTTNVPPGKGAGMFFFGDESQTSRVLQSARAMAILTKLCATMPPSCKHKKVTASVLEAVRTAADGFDQALAGVEPNFSKPSPSDPFFKFILPGI